MEIVVWIDDGGAVQWNGNTVDARALENLLHGASMQVPKPPLRFKGSETINFDDVAKVMEMAARHGLISKVGIINSPD